MSEFIKIIIIIFSLFKYLALNLETRVKRLKIKKLKSSYFHIYYFHLIHIAKEGVGNY